MKLIPARGVITFTLTLLLAHAVHAGAPILEVKGHLKSFSIPRNELVVTDEGEREWTFVLNDQVRVAIGREEGKVRDLMRGAAVTVLYEKQGEKLLALEIKSSITLPSMRESEYRTAEHHGEFAVMQVFYATDRAPLGESDQGWWSRFRTFAWGAVALVITLLLGLVTYFRRRWYLKALTGVCLLATLAATLIGFNSLIRQGGGVRHAEEAYGNDRGRELRRGTCTVSIPREHQLGRLESPSILRFEFRYEPAKHVVLQEIQPRTADDFFALLSEKVGRSRRKEAFVFIHGYNVSFEDAARRTAQLAYDLEFDGAAITYSWPSQAGLFEYTVDEGNVEWTVHDLRQFLAEVAEQSGAERIHLVAHSMGNRALTSALRLFAAEPGRDTSVFHEVILAAPDIDAEVFKRDIVPAICKTAQRITLYASSHDQALVASKQIHGYPRAGESGAALVVMPELDTIDVSAVDTSLLGHSYYGENRSLLTDLVSVVNRGLPPIRRQWLRAQILGGIRYWTFVPPAPE